MDREYRTGRGCIPYWEELAEARSSGRCDLGEAHVKGHADATLSDVFLGQIAMYSYVLYLQTMDVKSVRGGEDLRSSKINRCEDSADA